MLQIGPRIRMRQPVSIETWQSHKHDQEKGHTRHIYHEGARSSDGSMRPAWNLLLTLNNRGRPGMKPKTPTQYMARGMRLS
jgi:hypothetical protein